MAFESVRCRNDTSSDSEFTARATNQYCAVEERKREGRTLAKLRDAGAVHRLVVVVGVGEEEVLELAHDGLARARLLDPLRKRVGADVRQLLYGHLLLVHPLGQRHPAR